MPDPSAVQMDLKLVETLQGLCNSVREQARGAQELGEELGAPLARRLDRAAQLLDQAVRALRAPGDVERAPKPACVPGLTGTTDAVPLSSLVSFLADVNASGVLRIYASDESFVLQFEHGYLIYAFGDNPPEGTRLGEVLVRQGAIHRADLLRVLDAGWNACETLGGRLVGEGYVDAAQLETALEAQIQDLGMRLFSHDEARFRFYPDERVIAREDVRMNVMGLLLESARARDEERRKQDELDPPLFDLDVA